MNLSVDLGQIIIAAVIGVIGWLVSNKLAGIDSQLTKHDAMILDIWKYLTSQQRNCDECHNFKVREK